MIKKIPNFEAREDLKGDFLVNQFGAFKDSPIITHFGVSPEALKPQAVGRGGILGFDFGQNFSVLLLPFGGFFEEGREELRTKELIHYEPYFEGKKQKSVVLHPGFCLPDTFRICTLSSHTAMCIFAYLGFYTDLSF